MAVIFVVFDRGGLRSPRHDEDDALVLHRSEFRLAHDEHEIYADQDRTAEHDDDRGEVEEFMQHRLVGVREDVEDSLNEQLETTVLVGLEHSRTQHGR